MKPTAILLTVAFMSSAAVAQAADRPTVVELFTSQGCSSCPPAEAFLIDLVAERQNVLALAFHVDYWDRLGWKDAFSSPQATARQRYYAQDVGLSGVYTPQIVVDGRREAIGSQREKVRAAIRSAASEAPEPVPVTLKRDGGELALEIGAGAGAAWLIGFDPEQTTSVPRGENAGRTIRQANVVRSITRVADWSGESMALTRRLPKGKNAALIVQAQDGRIIGAAVLDD